MIQCQSSENTYIITINGLYLQSIKNNKCKLNSDKDKAKRFELLSEAEFFQDILNERHLIEQTEPNSIINWFIVCVMVSFILVILWQLAKGIN